MGKGNVSITPNITLSCALYVPNMFCNYFVTFFPTHCVFQDLTTRKIIGSAEEREGLYYLAIEEQGKIQIH